MEKQTKIFNVTKELFGEFGYKGTTIDTIVNKCEIAKGTFYIYYNSKEEILNEILQKEIEKVKLITHEVDEKELCFNDQLAMFLTEILKLKNDQIFVAKLVSEAKKESNEVVSKYIKKLDDSIVEQIAMRIENAINKKYIKECNVQFYAFLIYKTYVLLITEWEEKIHKKLEESDIYELLERLFQKN